MRSVSWSAYQIMVREARRRGLDSELIINGLIIVAMAALHRRPALPRDRPVVALQGRPADDPPADPARTRRRLHVRRVQRSRRLRRAPDRDDRGLAVPPLEAPVVLALGRRRGAGPVRDAGDRPARELLQPGAVRAADARCRGVSRSSASTASSHTLCPAGSDPNATLGQHFQPLFLYEAISAVIGLLFLLWLGRRFSNRLRAGDLLLIFFIWYGVDSLPARVHAVRLQLDARRHPDGPDRVGGRDRRRRDRARSSAIGGPVGASARSRPRNGRRRRPKRRRPKRPPRSDEPADESEAVRPRPKQGRIPRRRPTERRSQRRRRPTGRRTKARPGSPRPAARRDRAGRRASAQRHQSFALAAAPPPGPDRARGPGRGPRQRRRGPRLARPAPGGEGERCSSGSSPVVGRVVLFGLFRFRIDVEGRELVPRRWRLHRRGGRPSRLDGSVRRPPRAAARAAGLVPRLGPVGVRSTLARGADPSGRRVAARSGAVASASSSTWRRPGPSSANGAVFAQMPEGTISGPAGRIGPFRIGSALIALRTGAPIVLLGDGRDGGALPRPPDGRPDPPRDERRRAARAGLGRSTAGRGQPRGARPGADG